MPLQSNPKVLQVYKLVSIRNRSFTGKATTEQETTGLVNFFSHFNPFNWFSDFSNIEITLEEFAPTKK